jgi:hypothetical protein
VIRKVILALSSVALAAGAAACGGAISGHGGQQGAASPSAAASQPVTTVAPVNAGASRGPAGLAGSLRLLIEPQAGIGPIYRLITAAHS